jgi:predicted nucleotidyltransferase
MAQVADTAAISNILERVLRTGRPEKVVLFGSRARGDVHARSDFDLLVIEPSDEPRHRRASRYYRALADLPEDIDVVVYTPEEAGEWEGVPQSFVSTALREGIIVYEKQG